MSNVFCSFDGVAGNKTISRLHMCTTAAVRQFLLQRNRNVCQGFNAAVRHHLQQNAGSGELLVRHAPVHNEPLRVHNSNVHTEGGKRPEWQFGRRWSSNTLRRIREPLRAQRGVRGCGSANYKVASQREREGNVVCCTVKDSDRHKGETAEMLQQSIPPGDVFHGILRRGSIRARCLVRGDERKSGQASEDAKLQVAFGTLQVFPNVIDCVEA
mmetsp:Transcript_36573/g.53699  ORF Transcript_36573/g.53699 Transcript_36573/m.53699 type:complete len:213 (-) Transcript_36573:184-822(-)